VAESTRAGAWLFRWRSYPPVLVLGYVLAATALHPVPAGGAGLRGVWVVAGLALGALGLAVRGWTVGLVPMGTSGRGTQAQRAETLNTRGVYSLVRHPLYLGSFLLWIGVPVLAGRPLAALVTTLLFWLCYERIILAEERFLFEEHGAAFGAWAERTPAFLPRLSGWSASPHPFSLRYALGRDYPAFYGFVASTTAVELTRSAVAGEGWWISTAWLAWFVAGTTVYVVLHALKRLTRVLEAPDDR
jgi:protein-S-isoprenylcysteine O-methyltransferase Ste14